ncbi:hypothetical protein WJX72_001550 [[Myrmecia] bisecta]|uniref:Uncharacterized protein n=1 Tax=[Myrmecia] bisecta TaxID=41462 RepID=A0AAW1PGC3_9CHLO
MQVVETWKSKRFRKFHQYGDEEGTFRDPLEKGGSGGAAKTSTTGDPAEQAEHVKALEAAVVRLQDTLDGSQQDSRLLRNRLATLDKALQDKQKQDAGAAVYGRVHLERLASLQARVRELEAQPLVVIDAAAAERSGGQAEAVPVQLVIHVQELEHENPALSASMQQQIASFEQQSTEGAALQVLRPFPLHHDAGSGTDSSGGDFDWGAGEGGQADSWLKSELYRLACENDMLNERVRAYEREVEDLVAAGNLGHSNPKQKLQYHVRWKEELEAMRKQLTGLLRERFQLEQCVRYLAVKAGLVVEMNVDGSHERAPLERLQPASLVHHYKFAAQHPLTADLLPSTRHLWDDDDGAASVVSMASTASAASSRPSFAPVTPQKPGSHLASPNSKSPSTAGRTYSRTNSTAASHAAADGTIAPQLPSALSKATSQSAQQEGTKSASRGFGRTISAPQAHSSAGAPLTAAALQQFAESGGIASRPAGPGSEAGSLAVPVEGIEAQILARVALICSPNPAKKTKGQALRKGWV